MSDKPPNSPESRRLWSSRSTTLRDGETQSKASRGRMLAWRSVLGLALLGLGCQCPEPPEPRVVIQERPAPPPPGRPALPEIVPGSWIHIPPPGALVEIPEGWTLMPTLEAYALQDYVDLSEAWADAVGAVSEDD